MKKRLLSFILIFYSFISFSQVSIGKSDHFNEKTNKNTIEEINNFKNTITVFVLPDKEREAFENIIEQHWDITKYEFVSLTDYKKNKEKYIFPEYSFFKFDNYIASINGKTTTWFFLDLNIGYSTIKKFKPKGKSTFDTVFLATVHLSPVLNLKYRDYEDYNSGSSIMNYNVGFFKNQIEFINSSLKSNINFNCLGDHVDYEKLKFLKTNKLYLLNRARENSLTVLNNEKDSEIGKLLSKYEYEYELLSSEDLNKKILSNNEKFYYLLYTQINSKKIVSIIDSKTGEIVFSFLERLSYKLQENDFKKISDEIKKS